MLRHISPGVWLVLFMAAVSSVLVAWLPVAPRHGIELWVFDRYHASVAREVAQAWNKARPDAQVNVTLLTGSSLSTRMLSGFYSDTPIADLIEVERNLIGQVFAGPMEDVGFVDLTPRIEAEGLHNVINAPSFSPWSRSGHIFGLPHDVHPVMLIYRSDLAEAAGIDVTAIETWDDYFRLMRPLMQDLDGDGRSDRYLLNASPSNPLFNEALLLQAGGGLFAADGAPRLDSPINIRILANLATWYAGPNRVASEVSTGGASGLQLMSQGYVVGFLAIDWYSGFLRKQLPQLAGKFRIMPLPAWTKGGRRTSVYGGTMIGVTKAAKDPAAAWEFAKELYLSPLGAERLYSASRIVTPIRPLWDRKFYDEPDPYYGGQAIGRLYLELAPEVPQRVSSPYYGTANALMTEALTELSEYVEQHGIADPDALLPEAARVMGRAQSSLVRMMQRNVFIQTADR